MWLRMSNPRARLHRQMENLSRSRVPRERELGLVKCKFGPAINSINPPLAHNLGSVVFAHPRLCTVPMYGGGEDGVRLQISLAFPSPLKQGFPKRSLDILDSRNTSAPLEENRCKSLKLSRLWKRRLMILREEIEEGPLCRMGDISERDISARYAATLLTICSLARYNLFPRFFDKIFPSYLVFPSLEVSSILNRE